MRKEMAKAYEPQGVEDAIYDAWLQARAFSPEDLPNIDPSLEPFSIVLPPPNVTGTLHLGHATMLAIEDAMVRFARLSGRKTLWTPGTDHAAIATQSKVEGIIYKEEGKSRHDLGRDEFLGRVRQFAQESHDTIVNQCKKMGASLDWSREAYTLDEPRNRAVNTAFKRMYDDGLIYRGHRVVNWDPVGQTTIADDEIVYKETTATLYTFKYSKDFPIAISTTRPETKVGDTAVAVHPADKRYKKFIGQTFENIPFCGATITLKIVADESVEPDFGTGALGVTPAHSVVDFEIAQRHELPLQQVIGEEGTMLPIVGSLLAGQTTAMARQTVAAWLKEEGLLEGEEEIAQSLSTAERTGGVIEPLPKLQWFIGVNREFTYYDGRKVTLKMLMQEAVRGGGVTIVPDRFNKTYFHWIDNLRDWNISRQIWFGHRVPVWYRGEELMVGEAPTGEGWAQDEDTLDTWFSSGLWTFSTLGWPEETPDFKAFHPTTILETGYDILFFWVARMILMSTYLVHEVPFKTVYLHGLVRDAEGRKMSKSLGNIINPLDMIEKYGADATRLALVLGNTPGNDLRLSEEKIEGYRNFVNKLWNISRFILGKVEKVESVTDLSDIVLTRADRWILGRFQEVHNKVLHLQSEYDLSLAGETLREFTWGEFADWYLEMAKIEGGKDRILLYLLERLLLLWHPFTPFVTEEIYRQFENGLLMTERYDALTFALVDDDRMQIERLQEMATGIRNVRAQYTVEPSRAIECVASETLDEETEKLLQGLARLSGVRVLSPGESTEGMASVVAGSMTLFIPLAGLVDVEKERVRLTKEQEEVSGYVKGLEAKLANADFVARAPEVVITGERAKLADAQKKLDSLEAQIDLIV